MRSRTFVSIVACGLLLGASSIIAGDNRLYVAAKRYDMAHTDGVKRYKLKKKALLLCGSDELRKQLEQLAERYLEAVESWATYVQEHASLPTDSSDTVKHCILEMVLSAEQRERLHCVHVLNELSH